MASLVLSFAGAALGESFGAAGVMAGRLAGALAGAVIDRALFGARPPDGPRLKELDVLSSTEGSPIPRVYGRMRVAGQVIWAAKLTEHASGGGGKGSPRPRTYSYTADVAVGLCEGPIAAIGGIWADGKELDQKGLTIRLHRGTEDQPADPLILAKEGAGEAPAYRGLAYVVFEQLPLDAFGSRIPQLTFEVVRPVGRLETMVRSLVVIPGATEFGYEPGTFSAISAMAARRPRRATACATAPTSPSRWTTRRRSARTFGPSRWWSPGSATTCAPAPAPSALASSAATRRWRGSNGAWQGRGVPPPASSARSTAAQPMAVRRPTRR